MYETILTIGVVAGVVTAYIVGRREGEQRGQYQAIPTASRAWTRVSELEAQLRREKAQTARLEAALKSLEVEA